MECKLRHAIHGPRLVLIELDGSVYWDEGVVRALGDGKANGQGHDAFLTAFLTPLVPSMRGLVEWDVEALNTKLPFAQLRMNCKSASMVWPGCSSSSQWPLPAMVTACTSVATWANCAPTNVPADFSPPQGQHRHWQLVGCKAPVVFGVLRQRSEVSKTCPHAAGTGVGRCVGLPVFFGYGLGVCRKS